MATLEITGNLKDRFMQAAVLLYMLDPVRGEPTAYSLDQDPLEIEGPRERFLKRKFLDSFALICAVVKDGNSVSAACIEEAGPDGTVLRIASNSGVLPTTLQQLQEIVVVLNSIASGNIDGPDTEVRDTLLRKIVQLDVSKIRGYVELLRRSDDISKINLSDVETLILDSSLHKTLPEPQNFLDWLKHIFIIHDSPVDVGLEDLFEFVKWAHNAKYHYLGFLKAAFPAKDQLPKWIQLIFKLGRYSIACRALQQFSSEFPAMFNPMTVESINAPPKTRFRIDGVPAPLTSVLGRVVDNRAEEFKSQLARIWGTKEPEALFRKKCSNDLVVHAELQLLGFYDHNPQFRPFRFIGVSKKSCYLCHIFLAAHPESFSVSSCHQKLYPSWTPPTAVDPPVYRRYKKIITDLSKAMENTARRDLDTRLGILRRPVADSTAGVSLGGLTDSLPLSPPTRDIFRSDVNTVAKRIRLREPIEEQRDTVRFEEPLLTPTSSEFESAGYSNEGRSDAIGKSENRHTKMMSMVLHFTRLDDSQRQDIVCMGDIYDHRAESLSWAKLVEILSVVDGFGLAFKEGSEFLSVNDLIRVVNVRQFLACVQYLLNSGVANAKVYVCSLNEYATA